MVCRHELREVTLSDENCLVSMRLLFPVLLFFFFRFLFVYYAQVLVFPSYLRLNVLRTRNRIYP